MISNIDFYNYVYTPRIWQIHNDTRIKNILPTSKIIFTKLMYYLKEHPEFYSKLRTNLWRIHSNPISILSDKIPIELWYIIDSFIIEIPYITLIQKCKEYYINQLQYQIQEEINIQNNKIDKDALCKSIYCIYYDKLRKQQCYSIHTFLNNYKDTYLKN